MLDFLPEDVLDEADRIVAGNLLIDLILERDEVEADGASREVIDSLQKRINIMEDRLKMSWQESLAEKYPRTCKSIRCGASAPKGWQEEIEKTLAYIESLSSITDTKVVIEQIKTKFGGLRIYYAVLNNGEHRDLVTESIGGLISKAEWKTSTICTVCGKLASQKGMNPFCKEHSSAD